MAIWKPADPRGRRCVPWEHPLKVQTQGRGIRCRKHATRVTILRIRPRNPSQKCDVMRATPHCAVLYLLSVSILFVGAGRGGLPSEPSERETREKEETGEACVHTLS